MGRGVKCVTKRRIQWKPGPIPEEIINRSRLKGSDLCRETFITDYSLYHGPRDPGLGQVTLSMRGFRELHPD